MKSLIREKYPELHSQLSKLRQNFFAGSYYKKSYAQEGEDIVLHKYLLDTYGDQYEKGFYVDVGAFHPTIYSNTYFFYKRGWNGINIDPRPNSMRLFKQIRKRDINLELAISNQEEELTYYAFDQPVLNSFSKELSEERVKEGAKILFEKKIKAYPLAQILDKYLPAQQKIDFLTIDAEGLDLMVLQSNNWEKYQPQFIFVEILGTHLHDLSQNPVYSLLLSKGYQLISSLVNTKIFMKASHL